MVQKFYRVAEESSFAVALEMNFAKPLSDEVAALRQEVAAHGNDCMVHEEDDLLRLYMPAQPNHSLAEFESGKCGFAVFYTPRRGEVVFLRLMFRRKPDTEVRCARVGETRAFGFSCESGKPDYLPLAYPGKSGEFAPVFVRIATDNHTAFLRIDAVDLPERKGVAVRTSVVAPKNVPFHLCKLATQAASA